MNAQTYLFFNGRCEEALKFYADAVDAEVLYVMRYKDGPPELFHRAARSSSSTPPSASAIPSSTSPTT